MAKKKNINNVVIKDEELVPTTLGVYSNKTKNPISLILLIIVFISVAIFMPNIQNYINKMLGKSDNNISDNKNNNANNNGGNVDPDVDPDSSNENKKYKISSDAKIDNEKYTINNIVLNGTNLTLTITNKTASSFDLSQYYIELYSAEGTFIGRVKVSSNSLDANISKNYSFTVPSNSTTFSFVKKTVSDYPSVNLKYNENMEAVLSCSDGKKTYNYLFVDDQLSHIGHTYSLTSEDPNFNTLSREYQSKAESLNLISGVSSNFSETISSFFFSMNVDLKVENLELSKINDDNLFEIKTEPKVVKFVEEAKGFTCSQK